MDVQAIYTALVAIWPDGIPRDSYVAVAGIFKVYGDLEVAALQEKISQGVAENPRKEATAGPSVDGILQAYVSNESGSFDRYEDFDIKPLMRGPRSQRPRPAKRNLSANNILLYGGPPRKLKDVVQPPARPTTPKIDASRQKRTFVSEATIALVSGALGGGSLRTKEDIARQTKRSPRAVRYALAALQARGLVKRIERRGGQPHLFGLA